MAMVINTNVTSLNAQRNLDKSQGSLQEAMQRLSTGIRVNSAKHDAAGLAIATRFTTQIRGLDQAVRNANDGISLAQTGESAMAELTNNLQRIRELAVQSANATNSTSDRGALDQEVQQRLAEVTRIASQTSFNGQKILDGTFGNAQFQVGANVGETITVGLNTGVRANQIGQIATGAGTATVNAVDGSLAIQIGTGASVSVGASVQTLVSGGGQDGGKSADSAYAKVEAINAASVPGLTASAETTISDAFSATVGGTAADTYTLTVNGVAIFTATDVATAITGGTVAAAINAQSSQTGVTAAYDGTDMVLTSDDGQDIVTAESGTFGGAGFATDAIDVNGVVTLRAEDAITVTGAGTGGAAALTFTDGQVLQVDTTTLNTVDVNSVTSAEETILRIDSALTTISTLRSEFGAVQNRFESTIVNLQTISENLTASRGRIEDADFASETAKLTKAQILQQAGVSILSQANQLPQSVLGLLG